MSLSRSLILIAPRIGPALARAREQQLAGWPWLARLAGRGSICCLEPDASRHAAPRPAGQQPRAGALAPWQSALLQAVGLAGSAARFPSAAVTRSSELQEPAAGFWMHAQPLHLAAGMQQLSAMLLCGDNRVLKEERSALAPVVAEHLRLADLELVIGHDGEWLVHSANALRFASVSPEHAVALPLQEAMPEGADAAMLRRLMTELQMLLHEHPVNARRQARAALPMNALWLHGEGSLDPGGAPRQAKLPAAFGSSPYLRGLYRLHGSTVAPVPADATALLPLQSATTVVMVESAELDTLESAWFAPLAGALRPRGLARLELVLDRWRIVVTRGARLALWRTPAPPLRWPSC